MARTSRTNSVQAAVSKVRIWYIALYIRLSNADKNRDSKDKESNRYYDESESVTNQRDILHDWVAELNANNDGDQYIVVDEYIDDGISGTTDEEREDFQRMLGDIEKGRVNCVIVKTLARAFRNYSDQGYFLENYFPRHNVRFISIGNPRVDTYLTPEVVNGIEVPINGLMNDRYAYNTSCDIRRSFNKKRKKGEFIGSFAPYGYAKDPKDKNKLIVDEEAAEVVKQIFEMFINGMSKYAIMQNLNESGVSSPGAYKRQQGLNYNANMGKGFNPLWTAVGVDTILRHRVYIGDMVQGKHRVKSYKIHVTEKVAEDEWFIKENTHEAIIKREVFEKAQELLKLNTRTAPKQKQLYLFSGFLRCGDCGKAMARSEVKGNVYYRCTTYANQSKTACTIHTIKHHKLEAGVLYAVQYMVYLAASYTTLVALINTAPERKSQAAQMNAAVLAKEKELDKILRYKQLVYEDWKDGEVNREDYHRMTKDYEAQAARVREVLSNLKAERDRAEKGVDTENLFLSTFRKHANIEKLTRDVLIELVDHVKVYEGGGLSVKFKYENEMRYVLDYIALNTQEQDLKKAG